LKAAVTLKRKACSRNRSLGPLDEPFEGLGVGDVGGHDEGPAAGGLDLAGDLVEVGLGPGGEDDVGSGLGQPDGDAAADALAGAGDDGDLVRQPEAVEDH
jgi:hypothetical protein